MILNALIKQQQQRRVSIIQKILLYCILLHCKLSNQCKVHFLFFKLSSYLKNEIFCTNVLICFKYLNLKKFQRILLILRNKKQKINHKLYWLFFADLDIFYQSLLLLLLKIWRQINLGICWRSIIFTVFARFTLNFVCF